MQLTLKSLIPFHSSRSKITNFTPHALSKFLTQAHIESYMIVSSFEITMQCVCRREENAYAAKIKMVATV